MHKGMPNNGLEPTEPPRRLCRLNPGVRRWPIHTSFLNNRWKAVKPTIRSVALPDQALLRKYADGGGYTDYYFTQIAGTATVAAYTEAFYTTWVFKLERLLLAILLGKPSTDPQAKQLAAGARDYFSAWSVEQRADGQLLMCDLGGRTRTWLMAVPAGHREHEPTHLFLGSAIVPVVDEATGHKRLGVGFQALLSFHKLYSRVLLRAARLRLQRFQRIERERTCA